MRPHSEKPHFSSSIIVIKWMIKRERHKLHSTLWQKKNVDFLHIHGGMTCVRVLCVCCVCMCMCVSFLSYVDLCTCMQDVDAPGTMKNGRFENEYAKVVVRPGLLTWALWKSQPVLHGNYLLVISPWPAMAKFTARTAAERSGSEVIMHHTFAWLR